MVFQTQMWNPENVTIVEMRDFYELYDAKTMADIWKKQYPHMSVIVAERKYVA